MLTNISKSAIILVVLLLWLSMDCLYLSGLIFMSFERYRQTPTHFTIMNIDFEKPSNISSSSGLTLLPAEQQPSNRFVGSKELSADELENSLLMLKELQSTGNIREMQEKMSPYTVYGDQLIAHFLEHKDSIPKAWEVEGITIYAWGTHYHHEHGVRVRGMSYENGQWNETNHRIKGDYCQNEAVLVAK